MASLSADDDEVIDCVSYEHLHNITEDFPDGQPVYTVCRNGHNLNKDTLVNLLSRHGGALCPLCRQAIDGNISNYLPNRDLEKQIEKSRHLRETMKKKEEAMKKQELDKAREDYLASQKTYNMAMENAEKAKKDMNAKRKRVLKVEREARELGMDVTTAVVKDEVSDITSSFMMPSPSSDDEATSSVMMPSSSSRTKRRRLNAASSSSFSSDRNTNEINWESIKIILGEEDTSKVKNNSLEAICMMYEELSREETDEGTKHLAEALRVNTSLKEITLIYTGIGDEGAKHLAEALRVNTSLEQFHLGKNNIVSEGSMYLAEALKVNSRLKDVGLFADRYIGDELVTCIHLAEVLRVNTSLENMCFDSNWICSEGEQLLKNAWRIHRYRKQGLVLGSGEDEEP